MKRSLPVLVLLLLIAPSAAAIRPTSRPADPLAAQAAQAARAKSLPPFAADVEAKLRTELQRDGEVNLNEVLRLTAMFEFGRYFSRVTEPTTGALETLAWLAEEPDLLHALTMGVTPADPPDRVLEVLRGLRMDHRSTIHEFPDLAAAVCVVWDAPERFGPDEDVSVDTAAPSRVFDHFRKSADRLALDPRRLPIDLLVHVVDLHLNQQEVDWATRYGPRPSVAGTFFSVPYADVEYDRDSRELTERAYLLPNLLRRGGRVADAAYFASEIAKANGIPAAVCSAGAENPAASWTAFMQFGSRPTWDFNSARHREHAGWIGETVDPHTGETRSEAELALTVGALGTPARDRLASMALVRSVDLLPRERWMDAFGRAVDLSPSNLSAWRGMADFAAESRDADVEKKIEQLMHKHLSRRWPELQTVLRLRMLKGRGALEFERGIDAAAAAVRDRPELIAMVRLAAIDRYREDKRHREAEAALMTMLQRNAPLSPPAALAIMSRLDESLHREDGHLQRLSAIYRAVFGALPRPSASKHARTTPYYQIGSKYAQVLDELKDPQAASMLRTKLDSLVTN